MKKVFTTIMIILLLTSLLSCSQQTSIQKEENQPKTNLDANTKQKKQQEQKPNIDENVNTNNTTVNASDLKVGDSIDGHIISEFDYLEGQSFGIGLDGEFEVTGEINYNDILWDAIVLTISEDCSIPTTIMIDFDSDYKLKPPSGIFEIQNDNLTKLESKIGKSMIDDIKNGASLKVNLVINNYAFYAENYSEPFFICDIVEISKIESDVIIDKGSNSNDNSDETLIDFNGTSNGINYYKYKANKYVYFDLDNDGSDEKIIYDSQNEKLEVNGYEPIEIPNMFAETEYFNIIKFIDRFGIEMYMIGILDYGPSCDPQTTLYSILAPIGEKSLVSVGCVYGEIVPPSNFDENSMNDFNYKAVLVEEQGIVSPVRLEILCDIQTWFGRNTFTYYSTYYSLMDNNYKYELDYITNIELNIEKEVSCYKEKDTTSEAHTINAGQTVNLGSTDNKEWIYMIAEDGTTGWVYVSDVNYDNFSGFTAYD